ncbi:MAG TPA: hypothetical protein VGQ70_03060 [Candidatus Udaeobacter sp.]|jgi:hypothetical protein|nr:hypothetical protein [Candidatus Udaeobacter sp.]
MAIAKIADLWVPDIWVAEMREKQATFPSILNSGIAVRAPKFDEIASGAGVNANIPFFKDLTDQDDEIQVEDTGPSILGITSGKMVAAILNRVTKNSVTALAGQVSGSDPVGEMTNQLVARRMKQRNKTLIALLRGAFDGLGASGSSAELSAMRVDSFDETGNDATVDQTMSADLFITGKALMGELADELANGALLMHPNVIATLEIADKESFKSGVESGLPFTVRTYRGVPIFASEVLVRAGTINGYVYETYLLGRGIVALGEKPQMSGTASNPVIDVASLNYTPDVELNNERIYDRTRFIMHLNGMKYVGMPSGQSATNAELATAAGWDLVYSTANRVGAVLFRTNK